VLRHELGPVTPPSSLGDSGGQPLPNNKLGAPTRACRPPPSPSTSFFLGCHLLPRAPPPPPRRARPTTTSDIRIVGVNDGDVGAEGGVVVGGGGGARSAVVESSTTSTITTLAALLQLEAAEEAVGGSGGGGGGGGHNLKPLYYPLRSVTWESCLRIENASSGTLVINDFSVFRTLGLPTEADCRGALQKSPSKIVFGGPLTKFIPPNFILLQWYPVLHTLHR
jgi:hypothetical protein